MIVHDHVRETVDFATFFEEMRTSAGRFAYVLTNSSTAADEIAQDAFVQMFRRWDDIENPKAYLFKSVLNGSRSWARRERRIAPDDRPVTYEPDVDAIAVRTALAALPDTERELLVLRYFVGLSDREVADVVDRPLGTVKTVIRRGLQMMKEAFDE